MNFHSLSHALDAAGIFAPAAEVHGILCGALCGGKKSITDWRPLVLPADTTHSEVEATLNLLYQQSHDWLHTGAIEFLLLLPEDSAPLFERVEALAAWCQGFVLGLTATGIQDIAALPADTAEILEDMIAISQIESTDHDISDTQQEKDFNELQEYVRVGVQLIYDEIHGPLDS